MALLQLNSRGTPVPADEPRHRDPGRAWRSTSRWQTARAEQLQRQPWCTDCRHTGSKDNPLTADHIVPVERGGPRYAWSNLTTRCLSCNSAKGAR